MAVGNSCASVSTSRPAHIAANIIGSRDTSAHNASRRPPPAAASAAQACQDSVLTLTRQTPGAPGIGVDRSIHLRKGISDPRDEVGRPAEPVGEVWRDEQPECQYQREVHEYRYQRRWM